MQSLSFQNQIQPKTEPSVKKEPVVKNEPATEKKKTPLLGNPAASHWYYENQAESSESQNHKAQVHVMQPMMNLRSQPHS